MHAEAVERPVLAAEGVAVFDEFLTSDEIHALVRRLDERRPVLKPARIGPPSDPVYRPDIRGDLTCWIEPPLCPAEKRLIEELERLRMRLNREAWLGLDELELHYAVYPPGSGYARHLDRPHGRDRRRLSFIVYLNENWCGEDGGELRIFDAAGGHRDIVPLSGRLVCFLSAEHEHEVLPARRERRSVSGWFLGSG